MLSVLFLFCAAALTPEAREADSPPPKDARPNIILILTDDQRADTLGCTGPSGLETPNIDALAERGTRYANAYCQGSMNGAVCLPSRSMILTGRGLFSSDDWARAREDDLTTYPQLLREAGYHTYHTGKFHSGRTWFERGFDRGRSVLFGGMGSHTTLMVEDVGEGATDGRHHITSYSSTEFTDDLLEYLDERTLIDGPFYAEICFTAPHDPRTPPEEVDPMSADELPPLPVNFAPLHPFDNGEMTIRDEALCAWPREAETIREELSRYHAMIRHIDRQVGRLVDRLERNGQIGNTLIIFASDHGLAIGSHGLLGKQNLYEHSMKAPLIVTGGDFPPGTVCDDFVYLHDIAPTVLEAADITAPEEMDGVSLHGAIMEFSPGRPHVFLAYKNLMRSVREGGWKMIWYPRIGRWQLFNLADDPNETTDLARDIFSAPHYRRMQELLRATRVSVGDHAELEPNMLEDPSFDHVAAEQAR